jgi:hypothetical protein
VKRNASVRLWIIGLSFTVLVSKRPLLPASGLRAVIHGGMRHNVGGEPIRDA